MRNETGSKVQMGLILVDIVIVSHRLVEVRPIQGYDGIKWRIEPASNDFNGNSIAFPAIEAEYINITGLLDATVDGQRFGNRLCFFRKVIGFDFEYLFYFTNGEGHLIGSVPGFINGDMTHFIALVR